ncbi:hypothetical protein D3C75_556200 [compost metagenome]
MTNAIKVNEYAERLNISAKATGFWEMFHYLTDREEAKQESFVQTCEGMSRRNIGLYSLKMRKERLKANKFNSMDEFINMYHQDQKAALEKLFQEPLNQAKITMMNDKDPAQLYSIHSKQSSDAWFMECMIAF